MPPARRLPEPESQPIQCLRDVLGDVDVTSAVAAWGRGTDVATADVAGRPLFPGLVSLPRPDDPLGQLWHAATGGALTDERVSG